MKKLMLIAIIGMIGLTAFAQGPRPGGGGRPGPGGGRGPAPSRVEPRHHGGVSDDLAKASAIVGMVTDTLRIFNPPPPPRSNVIIRNSSPVIVRESSPRVIVRDPIPIVTSPIIETVPVVQEVVVEKPVIVEKQVIVDKTKTIKKIEPVAIGGKIYYKVTYTDDTLLHIPVEN